jgi:hypothetical protein
VEHKQETRRGAVDKAYISESGPLELPARKISGAPHEGDRLLRLESDVGSLGRYLMSRFPFLLFFLGWNFIWLQENADDTHWTPDEVIELFEFNSSATGYLYAVSFTFALLIALVVSVALSALGGFILRWTLTTQMKGGYTVEYEFIGSVLDNEVDMPKAQPTPREFFVLRWMIVMYFFGQIINLDQHFNLYQHLGVGHYMVAFYFLQCIKNAREAPIYSHNKDPFPDETVGRWEEVVGSRLPVEKYGALNNALWDPRFLKYVKAEGQET